MVSDYASTSVAFEDYQALLDLSSTAKSGLWQVFKFIPRDVQ
jgi:hypothetical protein